MRGWIQDGFRAVIAFWVRMMGHGLNGVHRLRVRGCRRRSLTLRARYGITPDTPIVRHGEALDRRLQAVAGRGVRFASTSGSSGVPKRIPYSQKRVFQVKALYMDAFCRAFSAMGVRRTSLYVFSAIGTDDSLTSLMMAERQALPPYFSSLQAPYRVHGHPAMMALEKQYGTAAVRLWVLVMSNPGAMYATNPSTVALFLERLVEDWDGCTALIRDWVQEASAFDRNVRRIARRLRSAGDRERMAMVSNSRTPLPFLTCVPALSFLCCWDGGYVRPYLDRVWAHLDRDRVRHLPMYSMSTETVETLPDFREPDVAFLPVAPGVLYEFLSLDSEEDPSAILPPEALKVGQEYSMVVSDRWGLVRYHTEDVFSVARQVTGLPDLRFERRLGLAFSFTGEKLTGDHARAAIQAVIDQRKDLSQIPWLVLVPSAEPRPHYKLVMAGEPPVLASSQIGALLDAALGVVNQEYLDKRRSGRLSSPEAILMPFEDALRWVGRQQPGRRWETQFKFLPMVTTPWEKLMSEKDT